MCVCVHMRLCVYAHASVWVCVCVWGGVTIVTGQRSKEVQGFIHINNNIVVTQTGAVDVWRCGARMDGCHKPPHQMK